MSASEKIVWLCVVIAVGSIGFSEYSDGKKSHTELYQRMSVVEQNLCINQINN